MRRTAAAVATLAALAASTPAWSASPGSAAAPPRAAACATCHGTDGHSTMARVPSLAGQPKVFLENTLILVREGLRPIPAMAGMLDGVDDAEIIRLAEHYARQPARPAVSAASAAEAADAAAQARGQTLAAQALCGTCHLPNYAGQQQMPRLAGQRQDYLEQVMRQFRDNRAEGRDTQMNGVMRGMSDAQISDLAHYFARLP